MNNQQSRVEGEGYGVGSGGVGEGGGLPQLS